MRPDFLDVLRAAREREFAFRVLTNGTLVGEREADSLARLEPTSVDFSLYGTEAVHDRVTGLAGSYARTRGAIDRVRARGVPLRIKMPLMKTNLTTNLTTNLKTSLSTNLGEFRRVKELAASLGATFVFDATIVCRPSGDGSPLAEQLSEDEILGLARELYEGRPVPRGGNIEPGEPFCSAGRSAARVTPSGGLTPCVAVPAAAGSLRERSFADLWRAPEFERLRAMRLADLPVCRECPLRDWCVRCPGQALVEDGDIAGPSRAACRMARVCRSLSGDGEGKGPRA